MSPPRINLGRVPIGIVPITSAQQSSNKFAPHLPLTRPVFSPCCYRSLGFPCYLGIIGRVSAILSRAFTAPTPPYRGHPIKIWGYTADTHLAAPLCAITGKLALHPDAPIPRWREAHQGPTFFCFVMGAHSPLFLRILCGNFLTSDPRFENPGSMYTGDFNNVFEARTCHVRILSLPLLSPIFFQRLIWQ